MTRAATVVAALSMAIVAGSCAREPRVPASTGSGGDFGQACHAAGCAPGLLCRFDRQDTLLGTCGLESGRCRFVTDCPPMYSCEKPSRGAPWIGVCVPRPF
jgi:hypothetical protein